MWFGEFAAADLSCWFVDDIVIDAPSVSTEPVAVQGPLNTLGTSVTVTTITPDRVVGSLDVVFAIPEGGSAPMTATFDAPYCWAPGAGSGK